MSIETYQFNLPITPGSIPPVLHLSQYDSGRTFTAVLRDDQGVPFELASSSTAVIKGRNAAGIAWQQDCTVSGANVTFTPSGAATDQFGVMPVTIEITESDEIMSPLLMVWNIQRAGYTNEEAAASPEFENALQAAIEEAITESGIAPPVYTTITYADGVYSSSMSLAELRAAKSAGYTVMAKLPSSLEALYSQDDSGVIFWAVDDSGGPLLLEKYGVRADGVIYTAYPIGSGGGLTDEVKTALMGIANNVAWDGVDGQAYIDALEVALYPNILESISAVYTQSGTVYDYESLDVLKADLVVTAHYTDSTSAVVTTYELSGTLEAGTSTITVTYGGKTTTFNVTVTADPLPSSYKRLEYVERPSGTGTSGGYNTTGFMLNGTDDAVIKMGVMLKATPSSNAGGYFLACRQTNNDNTIGFGIYAPKDTSAIGAFDGESCLVPPHSGQSVIDQKFDLMVTKTPTTLTVADGVNANTITRTPRVMVQNLHVFGLVQHNASQLSNPVVGRIYYLNIVEGGVEKVNFIPCVRNADNAVGFYDSVAETFKTSAYYTAGPEV